MWVMLVRGWMRWQKPIRSSAPKIPVRRAQLQEGGDQEENQQENGPYEQDDNWNTDGAGTVNDGAQDDAMDGGAEDDVWPG